MTIFFLLSIFLGTLMPNIAAVGTIVNLQSGIYRGSVDESGTSQWLGMRYAAAPLNDLRFAAPQDPPETDGIQNATSYGKHCLAVEDKPPVHPDTSEDCLFVNVYAPTDATTESRLPVLFYIQGGGFAFNANPRFDGRGLVRGSGNHIVVVTLNYRVGIYGFLAGNNIESQNNGLKDQRKALEWVKANIVYFGGDPDHIVIGGSSAGAASVLFHLTAYGARDDGLFHGAIAGSPSFAPILTSAESEYQYNAILDLSGCIGASDQLSCLRARTTDELQSIHVTLPYPGTSEPPLAMWNPVIDGDLIRGPTYSTIEDGAFVKVPAIFGCDANDGTIFAPRHAQTIGDSNAFLQKQYPHLVSDHAERLNDLYPNPNLTFPNSGSYWRQAAHVYGDIRYMCPSLYLAEASTHHGVSATWIFSYDVADPDYEALGFGTPHAIDVAALFGPENIGSTMTPRSYHENGTNREIVPIMQGYWTSFIRDLNPNTYRRDWTVEWDTWTSETKGKLLLDSPPDNTRMVTVDENSWQRCEYLWSIGSELRQ